MLRGTTLKYTDRKNFSERIAQFTVVCLVTWLLSGSENEVVLF